MRPPLPDLRKPSTPSSTNKYATVLDAGVTKVQDGVKQVVEKYQGSLEALERRIDQASSAAARDLKEGVSKLVASGLARKIPYEELAREISGLQADLTRGLNGAVDAVQSRVQALSPLGTNIWQKADSAIRLVRAFGDAPVVDGMGFNRERIAYYFDSLIGGAVKTTPMAALVNRVGDDLKALGMRVPTGELLDRLIPNALKDFDVSKILPDFAGIKLDRLFEGVEDAHGDREPREEGSPRIRQAGSKRAWLETELDVPFDQPATLFSFGPVSVRLVNADLHALSRIEATPSSGTIQRVDGKLEADWEVHVAGLHVVSFLKTALRFDESKRVRFDLSPDRVSLQGILKPISEAIAKLGFSDSGFSIRPVIKGGLPMGVQSLLDLPLPAIQFGAFGIAGLRLICAFDLTVELGGEPPVDFSLGTSLAIARKTAPFTLTIFILGGGGWFEAGARYRPMARTITTSVSIGLSASASLAIALGPVRGSVAVYFGVTAEFHSTSGGPSSLHVGILLLVRGEVQVFGFISVTIMLMLEAEYISGGSMVGRGTLSIKVKICWCFTLSFSTSVTMRFGGGGGGGFGGGAIDAPHDGSLLAVADGGFRSMQVDPIVDFRAGAERYLRLFH